MNFPFDLEGILQNISKIKLRGGVVGKVTIAVMVVSLALAGISWTVHNIWISLLALVLVFALAFTLLWRLITFADRNPQAALFEGAEFLVHEQLRFGTKAEPSMVIEATDRAQPQPIEGPAADLGKALEPDATGEAPQL